MAPDQDGAGPIQPGQFVPSALVHLSGRASTVHGLTGQTEGLQQAVTVGCLRLGASFFGAELRLHQGLGDRRSQARQPILEQIVGGARSHGGDGAVLADGARHQDEGDVQPAGLEQGQGRQTIELREIEVR